LVNIVGVASAVVYLYQADWQLQPCCQSCWRRLPGATGGLRGRWRAAGELLDQLIDTPSAATLSLALHDRQEALVGVMLIELHESLRSSSEIGKPSSKLVQRLSGSLRS